MRVIVDINHPAHVHFFKCPIQILRARGHDVLVASRVKDVTTQLLDELQIEHVILSSQTTKGVVSLAKELLQRDWRLYQLAKTWKADCLTAIGGTFSAHAGFLAGIPSIVFYDTENARLQNAITYPFVTQLFVPNCYSGPLPRYATRYPGYHELSYLHPNRFTPNRELALQSGLSPSRPGFLVRTSAWMANHDLGDRGWDRGLLTNIITLLSDFGQVILSTEATPPTDLRHYLYTGSAASVHHTMAFCTFYVGESATMASECAVLGVPAIYIARTSRGYTNEQEEKYGLVKNIRDFRWPAIEAAIDDYLSTPRSHWVKARQLLLNDTIDVANFVADSIGE
jgi:uncharacterized protein